MSSSVFGVVVLQYKKRSLVRVLLQDVILGTLNDYI